MLFFGGGEGGGGNGWGVRPFGRHFHQFLNFRNAHVCDARVRGGILPRIIKVDLHL